MNRNSSTAVDETYPRNDFHDETTKSFQLTIPTTGRTDFTGQSTLHLRRPSTDLSGSGYDAASLSFYGGAPRMFIDSTDDVDGYLDPDKRGTSDLEDEDVSGDEHPCHWGPIKPAFLQKFRSPKIVVILFGMASCIQGVIVNGLVSVVITTIERRFELPSTQSGMISTGYDVASVLCLVPVSYLGGLSSKPRWIGTGMLILGFGAYMFAMPHFFSDPYYYEAIGATKKCMRPEGSNETFRYTKPCNEQPVSNLYKFQYMLMVGQIMHGMGASPLFTLGVTYLHESLNVNESPLYLGIFYGLSLFGPAVGYLAGGSFLKIYTDFNIIDTSTLNITPDDSNWVGAWWLGFLVSGSVAILIAIPILGLPPALPGNKKLRLTRELEACRSPSLDNVESNNKLKDIYNSAKVLFTNPTFVFLCLAGASEGLLVSGFTAFAPKFIENQFSTTPYMTAIFVGTATVPVGALGILAGGFIVKKFGLKFNGIMRLCIGTSCSCLFLILVFLIQCPNQHFAGVNRHYMEPNRTLSSINLTAECNSHCQCNRADFDPVCGADAQIYFSACYAGCNKIIDDRGVQYYSNCSCVGPRLSGSSVHSPYQAKKGRCESDCNHLRLFLPLFAILIFVTFMASMPALAATLRCVPEKERSLSVGVQWILVRCLGTIPAPIYFGLLIDQTCQAWQAKCGSQGSCHFYDNATMGKYILGMAAIAKSLSALCMFAAKYFYKPAKSAHNFDGLTRTTGGPHVVHVEPPPEDPVKAKLKP